LKCWGKEDDDDNARGMRRTRMIEDYDEVEEE
jgi:hypothetical protein